MENHRQSNKSAIRKQLAPTAMLFLIFGIDLFASFPKAPVAIVKSIVMAFILLITARMLFTRKLYPSIRPTAPFILLFVYLTCLFFRLVNDFIFEGHNLFMYSNNSTLIIMYIVLIVCPVICFATKKFNIDVGLFTVTLQILCVCVLSISVMHILQGRIEISKDGRYSGEGVLDIIYLGQQGVSLILLSVYNLRKKQLLVLNIASILISVAAIGLSASRSSIMAIAFCLVIYFLIYSSSSIRKIGMIMTIFILLLSYKSIILWLNDTFQSYGITTFSRVVDYVVGNSYADLGRYRIFDKGWTLAMDNPFTGYGYLLPDGSYVHNIFIEQFMALGFVGGLAFAFIIAYALIKGYNFVYKNKHFSIIYILFIQYIIFGSVSRTIIALPQLWITLYAILHLINSKYRYNGTPIQRIGVDYHPDIQK